MYIRALIFEWFLVYLVYFLQYLTEDLSSFPMIPTLFLNIEVILLEIYKHYIIFCILFCSSQNKPDWQDVPFDDIWRFSLSPQVPCWPYHQYLLIWRVTYPYFWMAIRLPTRKRIEPIQNKCYLHRARHTYTISQTIHFEQIHKDLSKHPINQICDISEGWHSSYNLIFCGSHLISTMGAL